MNPYIAFSRIEGPEEGAILVIANTARAAKRLAWGHCWNVDTWTDQDIRLIRDRTVLALADQGKLAVAQPHVIESPLSCQACGLWGMGVNLDDGTCCHCGKQAGAALVRIME